MNDKESFDFAKGIFADADLGTEIGYQNACNNVQSSNLELWQKDIVLCQLHNEYICRKNIIEQGKRAADFTEFIYNFFHK